MPSHDAFEERGLREEVQKAIDSLAESPEFAHALYEIALDVRRQLDAQKERNARHRLIALSGRKEQLRN